MSQTAYDAVLSAVQYGKKIDRAVANEIASAMKTWATEKVPPITRTSSSRLPVRQPRNTRHSLQ